MDLVVDSWFDTPPSELLTVFLSTIAVLATAIVVIRIVGLRSLSKMSSFDFVVTVALGSIVASTAATSTPIEQGALAFATLLGAQWVVSTLRRRIDLGRFVDNEPLLLMDGSTMIQDNLDRARVTENDIFAKLRESNVTAMDQVLAVVLETTGDISVLHGEGELDECVLEGVRRPLHRAAGAAGSSAD